MKRLPWLLPLSGLALLATTVGPVYGQVERVETPLAPGVTYLQLTRPGPVVVQLLKVDLTQAGLTPEVAISGQRILQLEPLSQIAAEVGQHETVVAGINGGYALLRDDPYQGLPIGLVITAGELICDPWPTPRSVLIFPEQGRPQIERLAMRATVTNAAGKSFRLGGLNRRRLPGELVAYTRRFSPTTRILDAGRQLVVKHVFADGAHLTPGRDYTGTVLAAVDGQVNIEIPADGLVLAGSGPADAFLASCQLGEQLELRLDLLPEVGPIRCALGAGPRLVRDGKVSLEAEPEKLSVTLTTGKQPRTGVGFNDAFLYLAVVDGRASGYSIGMTVQELAQLLIEQGCTQAMELDGGGSSTMFVRDRVVNRPSDGLERAIASALLLTTTGKLTGAPLPNPVVNSTGTAPAEPAEPATPTNVTPAPVPPVTPGAAEPARIMLAPGELVLTPGEMRQLTVSGETSTGQKARLEPAKLSFDVRPALLGQVDANGRFKAAKRGTGRITASYGDQVASIVVKVIGEGESPLPAPEATPVAPVTPVVPAPDETTSPAVKPVAPPPTDGSGAPPVTAVEPAGTDTPPGTTVKPSDRQDEGTKPTDGGAEATPPAAPAGPPKELPKGERKLIDGFENTLHWTQKTYPSTVPGEVSIVTAPAYEGKSSCRIKYDFTTMDETRAVYAVYQRSIGSPKAVSIWVFGDGSGNWLRGRCHDKHGTLHYIDFAAEISWDHCWARCTAVLPPEVKGPVTWDDIYVVQSKPEVKNSGTIYLDQFEGIY